MFVNVIFCYFRQLTISQSNTEYGVSVQSNNVYILWPTPGFPNIS